VSRGFVRQIAGARRRRGAADLSRFAFPICIGEAIHLAAGQQKGPCDVFVGAVWLEGIGLEVHRLPSNAINADAVNGAMRAEGIVTFKQGVSNVLMTDWGLHLYYNNPSLVARRGFPWNLPANEGSLRDYSKGACPVADSLFERSILIPIPSCLTQQDEEDIMLAFEKSLSAIL
jgi:hypothetical protein